MTIRFPALESGLIMAMRGPGLPVMKVGCLIMRYHEFLLAKRRFESSAGFNFR